MMDYQEPNHMDEFFKKALDEADEFPVSEPWNTPSPEVWEKLKDKLPGKEKKSTSGGLWLALQVALVLFLGLSFFQNYLHRKELKELKTEIKQYKNTLNTIRDELTDISEDNSSNPALVEPVARDTMDEKPGGIDKSSGMPRKFLHTDKYPKFSAAEISFISPSKQGAIEAPFVEDEVAEIGIKSVEKRQVELDSPLKKKEIFPFYTQQKKANHVRAYMGFYTGPMFSKDELGELVSTSHKSSNSFTAGFQYGWNLGSHWSLETGVQFAKINTRSTRRKRIRYTENGERLNEEGLYESSFSFTLPGDLFESQSELVLLREQEEEVPAYTHINIKSVSTNQRNYVEIPLIGQYSQHWGRISLGVRAGLLNVFRLSNNTVIDAVDLENTPYEGLVVKHRHKHHHKHRSSYQLGLLLGTSLEYQVTDRWNLLVQPTYNRGFYKESHSHKRRTPEDFSLNVGIKWEL